MADLAAPITEGCGSGVRPLGAPHQLLARRPVLVLLGLWRVLLLHRGLHHGLLHLSKLVLLVHGLLLSVLLLLKLLLLALLPSHRCVAVRPSSTSTLATILLVRVVVRAVEPLPPVVWAVVSSSATAGLCLLQSLLLLLLLLLLLTLLVQFFQYLHLFS